MKAIRILGGGISGLTAAVNLKKHGVDVEVYERKNRCGKQTNDFQFLENWTFEEDVLDFLKSINIRTDFYKKPVKSVELLSPNLAKYRGKSKKILMYLIKRGKAKDSIDHSLERQAKNMGIKIFYNSKLKETEADIIATGIKGASVMAIGVKFRLKHPDKSVVLLDNNLSLNWYSYFIANDGVGEIVCINPAGTKDINQRMQATIEAFKKILHIKIKKIDERFGAPVSLEYLDNALIKNQYLIGESAGFQDHLAGFGMRYAFMSGYLAAKSISENSDYNGLWRKAFLKPLQISAANRKVFEKLTNEDFDKGIRLLKNNSMAKKLIGKDLKTILRRVYNAEVLSRVFSFIPK